MTIRLVGETVTAMVPQDDPNYPGSGLAKAVDQAVKQVAEKLNRLCEGEGKRVLQVGTPFVMLNQVNDSIAISAALVAVADQNQGVNSREQEPTQPPSIQRERLARRAQQASEEIDNQIDLLEAAGGKIVIENHPEELEQDPQPQPEIPASSGEPRKSPSTLGVFDD